MSVKLRLKLELLAFHNRCCCQSSVESALNYGQQTGSPACFFLTIFCCICCILYLYHATALPMAWGVSHEYLTLWAAKFQLQLQPKQTFKCPVGRAAHTLGLDFQQKSTPTWMARKAEAGGGWNRVWVFKPWHHHLLQLETSMLCWLNAFDRLCIWVSRYLCDFVTAPNPQPLNRSSLSIFPELALSTGQIFEPRFVNPL